MLFKRFRKNDYLFGVQYNKKTEKYEVWKYDGKWRLFASYPCNDETKDNVSYEILFSIDILMKANYRYIGLNNIGDIYDSDY